MTTWFTTSRRPTQVQQFLHDCATRALSVKPGDHFDTLNVLAALTALAMLQTWPACPT